VEERSFRAALAGGRMRPSGPVVVSSPNDKAVGGGACKNAQVPEDARVERIQLAGLSQNLRKIRSEDPVNLHHLRNGRLPPIPDERIAQFPKYAANRSVMNVCVGAIDIAQRFLDAMRLRFADDPCVAGLVDADGQAEFEWHIESRRARAVSIQLHPRKIVDGILGFFDKSADSFEPSFTEWNLESRPRLETECAKAGDVGQQEILEAAVVGDI
jgi:hypothetical protein